jgi:hypothetical protein
MFPRHHVAFSASSRRLMVGKNIMRRPRTFASRKVLSRAASVGLEVGCRRISSLW